MRQFLLVVFIVVAGFNFGIASGAGFFEGGIKAERLRVEYHSEPIAIDAANPRLSWIVSSTGKGKVQSAYQIIVASSEENIGKNVGDLWDSGKVASSQTNQIEYAGKGLESREQCWWKVMIWDGEGKKSDWSAVSSWKMGLMNKADWKAKWIGYDKPEPAKYKQPELDMNLDGCNWYWYSKEDADPQKQAPPGVIYFRKKITLAEDKVVERARFILGVDDEAEIYINEQFGGKVRMEMGKTICDVTGLLKSGENILTIFASNFVAGWPANGYNPCGLIAKMEIDFADGSKTAVAIDESWKVTDEKAPADWMKIGFDDSLWQKPEFICKYGEGLYGGFDKRYILPPPPYLRKDFSLSKPVKEAYVYVTALGLYEMRINGQKISDAILTPGWSDFRKRVNYNAYDVTGLLKEGDNAAGAILADGWYAGYLAWNRVRGRYGNEPRFIAQMEIEYIDGRRETIVTDSSWKASYGPIFEADVLEGVTYDAREEMPGWDKTKFDDSKWDSVTVTDSVDIIMQVHAGEPVRVEKEIEPIEITEPHPGYYVFDLGQNFSGFARLKIKGEAGQKVTIKFAETLNKDGSTYTANLRDARATETYICKGDGVEIWQPDFTFHGFRYVEVTGISEMPGKDMITGLVIHSDTPVVGSFECSNGLINQIYSNVTWSQRSNFVDVPTDCPQRDERMGWLGDAQIFVRAATYNMDVASFFSKWMWDVVDGQSEDGKFPDVAPNMAASGSGSAAWADAGIICPWTIYKVYNDKKILEQHYPAMQKWMEFCEKNSDGLLRPKTEYPDWLSIGEDTPREIIGTTYFAYSAGLMSEIAEAIGKHEDAKKYAELKERIKDAFNKAYVSEDGTIKGNTQCCYVLALYFDLLDKEMRPIAAKHLIGRIEAMNWHLSTGFVGLSYLMPVLAETGNVDTAYRLMLNETFPGWGYSIKNGATTIWERWDGWTEEKGFQAPGMNSFNHYSLGAVSSWLMGGIAGIETDGVAYRKIVIKPLPGGGLSYAKGSFDSINGLIKSIWRHEGGVFVLDVTVPANTSATVYVPTSCMCLEGISKIAKDKNYAKFIEYKDGYASFAVGSGDYKFESKLE